MKFPTVFSSMIKVLGFIVALLLVNLIANEIYTRLVLSHSYLYRTEAEFQEYKDSIQILIVGDSHPMSAVDTRQMQGAFNLTSPGENIIQTYYRLRYYLEVEPLDVKLVVLPLDLHSFSSFRISRFESMNFWSKYINCVELAKISDSLGSYMRRHATGNLTYAGGVSDTVKLLQVRAGLVEGEDPLFMGFRVKSARFVDEGNKKNNARIIVGKHLMGYEPLHPEAEAYFLRILDLLAAHDVKVVLVEYPVSREYYQSAGVAMDIPEFYRSLGDLLKKRSQEPPILDYHDLFWNDQINFSDPDHLNEAGASEFTRILEQDLEELGYLP